MDEIISFLKRASSKRLNVAIVGDCVIDAYHHVTANRVSPEFPIPVMLSPNDDADLVLPGGASNACTQFKYFDVNARLYALTDKNLISALDRHGVNHEYCEVMTHGRVPIKRRLYQGDFPLCRWDVESNNYGLDKDQIQKVRQKVFNKYRHGPKPDVTIFSDYNKGLFSTAQKWMESHRCISIVDPKNEPLDQWIGCTVFKPNMNEAIALSGGLTDWQEQCNYFHKVLSCPYVVITQGGDGVVGKMEGKFFEYRPQRAVQPESVIGAGDCFVAFLGMALGYGMTPRKAVSVAWEAGCIYVQRKHNKPVEPYDLMKTYDIVGAKCVQPESLVNRDFKLIFTNGCFDICHSGHLSLLRYCKSIGHKVVVAINSDQSIKNLKGSYRPIVPLAQRMEMLAHLECVDFVVSFDENDPTNVIQIIKPDILVKGGDYSPETVVGSDLVKDVRIFPLVPGQSTTGIIEKIQFQHSNPI